MGQILPVEVNTHVAGTLEFESGAIASVILSFDVWGNHLPDIEIHGEKGSLERAGSQPLRRRRAAAQGWGE